MKELKRAKTIEETYGYEAFDGSYFSSAKACREYVAAIVCAGLVRVHGAREDMTREYQRSLNKIFADPTPKAET